MAAINLQSMDDFMAVNIAKYERVEWQDISFALQECLCAEKFYGKGKPAEQNGPMVIWDVQYDYEDNFRFTAPYQADTSERKNTMTQGKMFWSFITDNYQYDLKELDFNRAPEAILRWIDVKEHGLDNSFFYGLEKAMFGTGPTSLTQETPPMASLLWWFPPYNTATGQANSNTTLQLASGVTNDFVGGDPAGFSAIGAGAISSLTYPGWRHRVGQYTVFSEDDALDTIVECMDKCNFTPARSYPQLVSEISPKWDLFGTYSRLKLLRKISSSQNDNFRGEAVKWKDTVMIRGVPFRWVPAWSNQSFGVARTDGIVQGIHWPSIKVFTNSNWNMVKSPPMRDMLSHTVRWRFLDHSLQLVVENRRTSFTVNSTVTVSETN